MAKLNVDVIEKDGKTVSQYGAFDKIWFNNGGSAKLTIGLKPGQAANLAFCKNKNDDHTKGTTSLEIDPGKKEGVFICKDFAGTSFAYTAQIEGTVLEDPIIIIQQDDFGSLIQTNWEAFAIGVGVGAVVAVLVSRVFMRRRPT